MTEAVELRSGSLTARVVARGAELKSLRAEGGPELIFQADPAWWEFSAPLLSIPTVGPQWASRLPNRSEGWLLSRHTR